MVVGALDYAEAVNGPQGPNYDATGRATTALALWECFTGIDDADEAIAYARRLADPEWPGWYLTSDYAVHR